MSSGEAIDEVLRLLSQAYPDRNVRLEVQTEPGVTRYRILGDDRCLVLIPFRDVAPANYPGLNEWGTNLLVSCVKNLEQIEPDEARERLGLERYGG